ncbi:MAG: radical SAM protein [Thermoguttaceae bacterium]|nr:radical SAM protein [Thermoguttaceae bacterium]MDW8037314.1 radical SAM/SPASM domain-containing protein [Thermoguttaceae bacterium]
MVGRWFWRLVRQVSPGLLWKAAYLWVYKGLRAVRAFRRRQQRGELFPPFLFLSLTNACNLRCRGCWITAQGTKPQSLSAQQVDRIIQTGKQRNVYFYTLLGGEPFLYPDLQGLLGRHPDCYFQIITNGLLVDDGWARRLAALGNVTLLVSLDGLGQENDERRGQGTAKAILDCLDRLRRHRLLFGVATTVTSANFGQVTADQYVSQLIRRGALYLWYYVYRPMGPTAPPGWCLDQQQMLQFRRRLLELRRRHPILIVDTYWDAEGRAFCPAAEGLGFHIGPLGSIEPCPPLSFACEQFTDGLADFATLLESSQFLRQFQQFVHSRTRGCVILERPGELAEFLQNSAARDYSGRNMLAELTAATPQCSHHLPGQEIPEDSWFYRLLKRRLFFGLSGYG